MDGRTEGRKLKSCSPPSSVRGGIRSPRTTSRRARQRGEHSMLSLFTGAGALDLGLEAAGFVPLLCVEIDGDARDTLATNRPDWRLSEPGDIHELAPTELMRQAGLKRRELALLAGGPPCQPFSKSVYWNTGDALRLRDPRAKTLQAYLDVVEATLPQVLLLENVRGLAFNGKDEGRLLLVRGLEEINRKHRTRYRPQLVTINAAEYGVPQLRERVFLLASIDGRQITLPAPTHGASAGRRPFVTAWDAIGDLQDEPCSEETRLAGKWARLLPSIPEGENYLWHTPGRGGEPLFGWRTRFWSFLLKLAKNRPAWTIQALPGPATGPFHWKNRRLSVRELCRLQTIPDNYVIRGNRASSQRQIGNAVPCAIAELIGLELRSQLLGEPAISRELTLLPGHHGLECPPSERRRPVPAEYLSLRGKHRPHPGAGRGPGARTRSRASDLHAASHG